MCGGCSGSGGIWSVVVVGVGGIGFFFYHIWIFFIILQKYDKVHFLSYKI